MGGVGGGWGGWWVGGGWGAGWGVGGEGGGWGGVGVGLKSQVGTSNPSAGPFFARCFLRHGGLKKTWAVTPSEPLSPLCPMCNPWYAISCPQKGSSFLSL